MPQLPWGLLRYVFVAGGCLWPWLRRPLPPSSRRQTICVVQVVGLSLTIVPVIPTPLTTVLAAITLSALCYSFLVDVVWLRGAAQGGRADLVGGAEARQPTGC
jgi:hypothetical protein